MRQYKSLGSFPVPGMGRAFSVTNDETFEKNSSHMLGEHVEIDGAIYTVRSIGASAHGL